MPGSQAAEWGGGWGGGGGGGNRSVADARRLLRCFRQTEMLCQVGGA